MVKISRRACVEEESLRARIRDKKQVNFEAWNSCWWYIGKLWTTDPYLELRVMHATDVVC